MSELKLVGVVSLGFLGRGIAACLLNGRGFYEYSPEDAKNWEERFRRSVWQVRRWHEELAKEAGQ